jgi:hypothetical protein
VRAPRALSLKSFAAELSVLGGPHLSMILRLFLAGSVLVITAPPIPAQIVDTLPARPTNEVLKSLQTGRERWSRARVAEYRLQSHVDCFCVYGPEDFARQLPLLTIRNGSIIARAKGKPGTPPSRDATIDDLFAMVEEDARSSERIIDRLELHPAYGFPLWYKAHDPEIPDGWLQVKVDSFAVTRRH